MTGVSSYQSFYGSDASGLDFEWALFAEGKSRYASELMNNFKSYNEAFVSETCLQYSTATWVHIQKPSSNGFPKPHGVFPGMLGSRDP